MLNLSQILPYYPEHLHTFKEFILREYLQYKILDIIYASKWAQQLVFLGGTCLRIVHDNRRFSEDIDFDNLGLTDREFKQVGDHICKQLSKEGYNVEVTTIIAGAFHCHIKFPALQFEEGLSGHKEQKIQIRLDTEPQNFAYEANIHVLNKFDVFATVKSTPLNLLLSQKLYAILNRERNKGRDFFDVVFLLGLNAKVNYAYLKKNKAIANAKELKKSLLDHCATLDMNRMAFDVEPFLFAPKDMVGVLEFTKLIEQTEF